MKIHFQRHMVHFWSLSAEIQESILHVKIYLFNPPCPPYPARHKARKQKPYKAGSIDKFKLIHMAYLI